MTVNVPGYGDVIAPYGTNQFSVDTGRLSPNGHEYYTQLFGNADGSIGSKQIEAQNGAALNWMDKLSMIGALGGGLGVMGGAVLGAGAAGSGGAAAGLGASEAGLSSAPSWVDKIAEQLIKRAAGSALAGSAAGGGTTGSVARGVGGFGSTGTGYTPNQLANETPGLLAAREAPRATQQAQTPALFLGGTSQPQFNGVDYMQVPQEQNSQLMKLAQSLQQDQNYG